MSNIVHCPKCSSEQFVAQKRGFSGGKAVAGAVLTGGVGAVAGFHGSDKIDLLCLSCGHKWDPIKVAQQKKQRANLAQMKRTNQALANDKIWLKQFYTAYEKGDRDGAESIIRQHLRKLVDSRGLDEAYRMLKQKDRISTIMKLIFLALFIALIYWMTS